MKQHYSNFKKRKQPTKFFLFSTLLLLISNLLYSQSNSCSTAENLIINGACDSNTLNSSTNTLQCGISLKRLGWYTFTVTSGPQNVTITAQSNNNNLVLGLFSGNCTSLTPNTNCLVDNDSNNGTQTETITQTLNNGTYWVLIGNTKNSNLEVTSICVTSPPSNENCTNAIDLPCGTTNQSGTTTGTNNSTHGTTCSLSNYGVWYTFTGDGFPTTITSSADFDHEMSINSGNCGSFTNVYCSDDSTGTESYTFTTNSGTNYYIYIAHYSPTNATTGNFSITRSCVTCADPISSTTTNITTSSATINWLAPANTPSNGYEYYVSTSTSPPSSGTTTNSITANITSLLADTTYYVHVRSVCGINDYSNWVTSSFATGYCIPNPSSIDGEGITNVTIGTINNTTSNETGNYGNYSTQNTSGQQGETINFSLTLSTNGFNYGVVIWIDWNDDFNFDSSENVFTDATTATISGSFQIPVGAILGNHRMRIAALYSGTPSPCYNGNYGAFEDYTLNITSVACPGPINIITDILTQTETTVSWTEPNPAPNTGYQYYLSTSATNPTSGTPPTGSVGAGTTTLSLTGLIPTTTYFLWIRSNCDGVMGFWIGPNSFTMPDCTIGNSLGTTSLGCPSVVSGGLGLNGADLSPVTCSASSNCVDLEATYLVLGDTSNYTVESIAYNPPYQFGCLKNPVSVNTDDVWSPTINLPFDFCFYNQTYNKCLIGSNGVISFDINNNIPGGTCGWSFNTSIPISGHSALVENAIFGAFHDIDPGEGGEVGWELITLNTGCRALVASWNNVPMFSSSCNSMLYTGMIVLYENTNVIEVYIQEKQICSSWNNGNAVIGIQNADGTIGTVAPNRNGLDTNWSVNNEAWRFVPSGNSITSIAWHEGSGTSGPIVGTTDIINVCPTSTKTYTAAVTYTLCDGSTLTETEETTVTIDGAKIWNGSINSDWDTASNWTPTGVPTIIDCIVVPITPNNPIISGSNYQAYGLNLSIEDDATLTVNSNNNITIQDWINANNTGDLVLLNNASLVQLNDVSNIGTMHMNRTAVIKLYDYVYWSSPVTSFAAAAVSPSSNHIYKWIPTVNNGGVYTGNFGNWTSGNENMTVGKGYIIRSPNNFTTSPQAFTATFIGTPNNGTLTTPIARGNYAGVDYTGPTNTLVTENDDNWNLIGNPYPSAIDAISFLNTNSNIDGFINIWTHGNSPATIADPFYQDYQYNYTPLDYITFNSVGASSGPATYNGYIPAGQSFFVLMNHNSSSMNETVLFDNTMRSNTFDNSQFFKSNNINHKNRIWLDLTTPNNTSVRTLIGYVPNATYQRDRMFDAITDRKMSLNFYSLIDDEIMIIQGRSLPFKKLDIVPLGIAIPSNGIYSISIAAIDGLFENENQMIYLEDLENNIIHDLKAAPYSFTVTQGSHDNRFLLRYTNNKGKVLEQLEFDNEVIVKSKDNLTVLSTKTKIQSIIIFDVLGRILGNYESVNSNKLIANEILKNNSAIILQIKLTDGTQLNKKVLY